MISEPMLEIIIEIRNFIIYIIPPVISLFGVILVYMINKFRMRIKEKEGIEALNIFDDIVETVVSALNQTVVDEIKNKQKRKLNDRDIKHIKNKAKKEINDILLNSTKRNLKYIINNYDRYLDDSIESKIKNKK